MSRKYFLLTYLYVSIQTGLVAVNWIVVTGDEWAAQKMLDVGGPYALCPLYATKGKVWKAVLVLKLLYCWNRK